MCQPILTHPLLFHNSLYLNNMINIDKSRNLQIFDLGNVLIDVDARKTLAAFESLGMPHIDDAQISNSHVSAGLFSDYCDGKISTPLFITGLRQQCHISGSDDEIKRAWNAMLGNFRLDALNQVIALRNEGFKLALLSNCNALHTAFARASFPLPGALDDLFSPGAVFFSQEIGMSKPNPQTWQKVLAHFNAQPSDAVFYDDSQINVDAAIALGINAFRVD